MAFDPKESAEWALAVNTQTDKLLDAMDKALTARAAMGFPAPPGDALQGILDASIESRLALTQASGKIYDEGRARLFQIDEFTLKVLVRIAKLSMELYRERLMNALALEEAQVQADTERSRADVARLNSETEARMAGVIRAKAEVEQSIVIYRQQLVDAERKSLAAEALLINAELETAQEKLRIIESIYQVIAAEELVLAAERRRAESLEKVLAAQTLVAAVKREMIPFHLAKAEAREDLAEAVTKEAAVKEALERLGYDRLELKTEQEDAEHQVREIEHEVELARAETVRANKATEVFRVRLRRILQEYANQVREGILDLKKELEKDGVDFKLSTHLSRLGISLDEDVTLLNYERDLLGNELRNLLDNMVEVALDNNQQIRESADTRLTADAVNYLSRRIVKGYIVGRSGSAMITGGQ